jgi:hypothetical protein
MITASNESPRREPTAMYPAAPPDGHQSSIEPKMMGSARTAQATSSTSATMVARCLDIPQCADYTVTSREPVSRSYASRYFALVRRMTSSGSSGAGGVLSQVSVSR